MTDLRDRFIFWYYNQFQTEALYRNMCNVKEDSPWHRERNVGTHTDMVVAQYLTRKVGDWDDEVLCGAFACAFHDVGKPAAEEVCFSEERGEYRRYAGHEKLSARLWEDYAATRWPMLTATFKLQTYDIYRVGFLIEKHLPFGLKDPRKKRNLAMTILMMFPEHKENVFDNVLLADSFGRIADDMEQKRQSVVNWIIQWTEVFQQAEEFLNSQEVPNIAEKTLFVPIGASGCGKSTFIEGMVQRAVDVNHDVAVYSWDQLRLDWYLKDGETFESDEEAYRVAFQRQIEDKDFKRASQKVFVDMVRILENNSNTNIVVDNTNTSGKSRNFFINEARNHGYRVTAILFPIELTKLMDRQIDRKDKSVPEDAVCRHYMNVQLPSYGEFDDVWVLGDNLDVC